MKRLVIAAVLAFGLLALSCGGGTGSSNDPEAIQKSIQHDVQAFADAFAAGKAADAYEFLASDCRQQVSAEDFAATVALARAFVGEDWGVEVKTLAVVEQEGDSATVEVSWQQTSGSEDLTLDEETQTMTLVRENGRWRDTDCESYTSGSSGTSTPEFDEEEEAALLVVNVGEPFWVDAGALGDIYDEEPLSGSITVRVTDVAVESSIDSQYAGPQTAQGEFVEVDYEVVNDLDGRMQPGTQINDNLVLVDGEGRRWQYADYQGDYMGISGDAAEARGCKDPDTWIGAGFTACTAVVFDVPTDASGLSLRWSEAEILVDLGQ